jgi:hypothetical protein
VAPEAATGAAQCAPAAALDLLAPRLIADSNKRL